MRESLGSSLLLNIVVIFTGIVILFFVSILSYSKAYRVKNRIVELVEKNGSYENASVEIDKSLSEAGYAIANKNLCTSTRVQNHLKNEVGIITDSNDPVVSLNTTNGYNYCIFEVNSENSYISNGKFYVVVTFVQFEIPIIEDLLTFPVYGETKILGKIYNY